MGNIFGSMRRANLAKRDTRLFYKNFIKPILALIGVLICIGYLFFMEQCDSFLNEADGKIKNILQTQMEEK